MGRDRFEGLCYELGLTVERQKNPWRTTDSSGVIRFNNLLIDKELSSMDQAYSSDITYYEVMGRFHYLTFVLDCYSRRILGYSVSKNLTTEQNKNVGVKFAQS